MNENVPASFADVKLEASCRVPLLALFGGAAVWLVVSSALALIASLNFHMPEKFAHCAWLTYGRVFPAANDALLYGFCVPAGIGVAIWILSQLGRAPLRDPLVPVFAANLWHLGVLVGLIEILSGNTTGFDWLEFQRGGSVLLFFAYLLLAAWAMMVFTARRERALQPPHWFLIAALFWFPWVYATANLFLVAWPVRGIAQSVIALWFANNFIFVWLSLIGLGTAFYFFPRLIGRPLQAVHYALFAFWSLILFGTFCGIPHTAPVPAWMPTLSSVGGGMFVVLLLTVTIVEVRTVWGFIKSKWDNGPFCFIGSGADCFVISLLMMIALACPAFDRTAGFTWFTQAQLQLQIYGFFAMTMFGAIYYLLPRAVDLKFPFPKLVAAHYWMSLIGIVLLVLPLAIGGIEQGLKLDNAKIAFPEIMNLSLMYLRVSTVGICFILIGNLLFALNVFVMTCVWKMALLKKILPAINAPLETSEVKS
ncbi:MAG TPA: cbb3-type cytochrome c oxidase subunit I [Verrucomicrobiae bacterium]|nr:cbb3-type cytochrome c oxidase subunit I [Verrucomicrobiae bacterium]